MLSAPLVYPLPYMDAVGTLPLPAGCAIEGSVGGSMGDSGSYSGEGGVGARAAACLYCCLKEEIRLMVVVFAGVGGRGFGGARYSLGLASQSARLRSGGAVVGEASGGADGRGHILN
jgi:hypothetical protein